MNIETVLDIAFFSAFNVRQPILLIINENRAPKNTFASKVAGYRVICKLETVQESESIMYKIYSTK